jgi:hypothetical protein
MIRIVSLRLIRVNAAITHDVGLVTIGARIAVVLECP